MTTKVLILGGTGMLGHVLFRELGSCAGLDVQSTVRRREVRPSWCPSPLSDRVIAGVDANDFLTVASTIRAQAPQVVINCIGIIKQLPEANQAIPAITINALFPHLLARTCREVGARLIHVSTDCVFSGRKGCYTEVDQSDAEDLYGRSKYLGEVAGAGAITLRTSIIGHELAGHYGLVEWFLAQVGTVQGYRNAIYSGLTTVEMARLIAERVMPHPELSGVYHVSAEPISKCDLLALVAKRYGHEIRIVPSDDVRIDRSLDSTRFRRATGYHPPPWEEMIDEMYRAYRAMMPATDTHHEE